MSHMPSVPSRASTGTYVAPDVEENVCFSIPDLKGTSLNSEFGMKTLYQLFMRIFIGRGLLPVSTHYLLSYVIYVITKILKGFSCPELFHSQHLSDIRFGLTL